MVRTMDDYNPNIHIGWTYPEINKFKKSEHAHKYRLIAGNNERFVVNYIPTKDGHIVRYGYFSETKSCSPNGYDKVDGGAGNW